MVVVIFIYCFSLLLNLLPSNLLKPDWSIKTSEGKNLLDIVKFDTKSSFTIIIDKISAFWDENITVYVFYVAVAIGLLSIIAHFITYIFYIKTTMRLNRWKKHGKVEDIKYPVDLVTNNKIWASIKIFVLRNIRTATIPIQYINQLEKHHDNDDKVMQELERTVYELKHAG